MRPLAAFLAAVAACTAAFAGGFDAYEPKALTARVEALAAAGDYDAARILLERAERIAPRDASVLRARQVLEARVAGHALPGAPMAAATAPPANSPARAAIPEAPPKPWPLR